MWKTVRGLLLNLKLIIAEMEWGVRSRVVYADVFSVLMSRNAAFRDVRHIWLHSILQPSALPLFFLQILHSFSHLVLGASVHKMRIKMCQLVSITLPGQGSLKKCTRCPDIWRIGIIFYAIKSEILVQIGPERPMYLCSLIIMIWSSRKWKFSVIPLMDKSHQKAQIVRVKLGRNLK